MKKMKFDCGCEFEVLQDDPRRIKYIPKLEHTNMHCPRTWELIQSGKTKGMFQIESQLGKKLSKDLKPENLEHLSALVAIMRPGVLESEIEGKSITEHYIDRKNNKEETTYLTPALEPILKDTFGCLIYQEQILAIAKELAGFTLQEADELRRGVGKKKPEIIAKCKKLFKEKAKQKGIITEEEADIIFDWIEKSQRYSFNKSHSIAYACGCYLTAYSKAHFPRGFFTSYLTYSKDKTAGKKSMEVKELVSDAKAHDITVKGPDVRNMNVNFRMIGKDIYFGISNISGIGESMAKKILDKSAELNLDYVTWPEYLFHVGQHINSNSFENLIECGAIDFLGVSRNQMLLEYKQFCDLSEKEITLLSRGLTNDENSLEYYLDKLSEMPTGRAGIASEKRRIKIKGMLDVIRNPPHSTKDTPEWIAGVEQAKLGVNISASRLDNNHSARCANTTILELNSGVRRDYILVACIVKRIKEVVIKKGQSEGRKMAFLTVEDETGMYESAVVFADVFDESQSVLLEENTVMLGGELKKNKDSYNLVVQKVFQI